MPFIPEKRHYEHAPIKEALIGLVIEPPLGPDALQRIATQDLSERGYAAPTPIHRAELQGRFEKGRASATAEHELVGYKFVDGGGLHIAQLTSGAFAFSRLAPYQDWAQLRDEARAIWGSYRAAIEKRSVNQVELRYVNQIDMPEPVRDFRDYIRTYAEVSSDLPQSLSQLFLKISIPLEADGLVVNLTQMLVPPPRVGFASVILDIGVVKTGVIQSDSEIWDCLELLRDQKNRVFEACITNRTRELIS